MRRRAIPIFRAALLFHLLAGAILIATVGLGTTTQVRRVVEDYQDRLIDSRVQYVQHAIGAFLMHNFSELQGHAAFPFLIEGLAAPQRDQRVAFREFLNELSLLGYTPQFVLLSRSGAVAHATREWPRFDYSQDESIRRILQGMADSAFSLNFFQDDAYWRIAVPVYSLVGVEGVLLTELPFSALEDEGGLTDLAQGVSLRLVKDGTVLAQYGPPGEGQPRVEVLENIPSVQLQFFWDKAALLHERNILVARIVVGPVIVIMGVLALVLFLVRRVFTSPLREFRVVAHSVAEGGNEVLVPERQITEELAVLARDFNTMTARVAAREDALQRTRDVLEVRVRERTRELHSALESVSERESVVRAMNDAALDAMVMIDAKGVILFWNKAAEELFGYTTEEALGRDVHEIIAPADARAEARAGMEQFAHSGTGRVVGSVLEFEAIRKDGSRFLVERAVASFEHQGEWYAIGSIRDASMRRETEEELRRLSLVARQTDNAVIITNSQGRVEWVNEAFTRMTGYTIEDMAGKKPGSVLQGPETNEDTVRFMSQRLKKRKGFKTELINYTKTGQRIWLAIEVTPVRNAEGAVTHFIAVESDVTERKAMEAELVRSKLEADAANAAKGDFLARMSHEIRTPLNAVIGLGHLLRKSDLSGTQADYVEKISVAAQSLLGVINDILDFSRIESGRLEIETVPFSVRTMVKNVVSIMGLLAEEKGLELRVRVAEDVPEWLEGDPLRLRQIVTNFLSNAIKFTERGEVRLSVGLVHTTSSHAVVEFVVADTGIGMSKEQQRRLFTAFWQAEASTSRRFGGSGLGLVISKHLAELMDGTITVESAVDEGSTFTFTVRLPINETQEQHIGDEALEGKRVLVVDNSETSRELLLAVVQNLHMAPMVADSGASCLASLRQAAEQGQPVDVVVMTWRMPGMDGVETARAIAGDATISPKPGIVLMTAFGKENLKKYSAGVAIDAIVDKPVDPEELAEALREVFAPGVGLGTQVQAPPPSPRDTQAPLEGIHLLVVEDNSINQQVAQEILQDMGAEVTLAANGKLALEELEKQTFDGVLMDIQMPVMDGYEAARHILEDTRFSELPIVAMTAHAMAGDRKTSLDAGMNEHVTKPIDPSVLLEVLERILLGKESTGKAGDSRGAAPAPSVAAQEARPEERPALPNLVGVDVVKALGALGGKVGLLRSLLMQFGEQYAFAHEEVRRLLEAGDAEQARVYAHTMKGVSANLGMDSLSAVSKELEAAIVASGTDVAQDLMERFERELFAVVQSLHVLENTPEAGNAPQSAAERLDDAAIRATLRELNREVSSRSFTAGRVAARLVSALGDQTGAQDAEAIVTALKAFDYVRAAEVLAALAQRLDVPLVDEDDDAPEEP
ncbi:hybrid sensor histidine kinase/response regulator [Desulfobaculum senezii]